jgi:hypothetical protein
MHTIYGEKMQYRHYDHNPHYLWEAKMLNPYIKHGTFLVELMTILKPSKEIDFLKLKTK